MGCDERGRVGGISAASDAGSRPGHAGQQVVYAIYWRTEEQRHWTHELTLKDPAEAEQRRCALLGRFRGRHRIDRTTLIEYPLGGEVKLFVPVGKEHEAAEKPAAAVVADSRRR